MFSERGLREAMARDDVFKAATAPTYGKSTPLLKEVSRPDGTLGKVLTGYGREYLEMLRNGYRYDAKTGELVRGTN
jgi:hypothetical protein